MIYLNLLSIGVIFVCITDIFRFWEEFSPYISKWLTNGRIKKPIEFKLFVCSACQTHWMGLLYLILTCNLSIFNYMILLLIALSTSLIYSLLQLIMDIIIYFIKKINNKIC